MLIPDVERPGERRVKVLDFGIAKLTGPSDGKVQTETGTMIGTPAYMAPEQCTADPTLDGKADVYALGIMLYEMLTGRLPFEAKHAFDFMAAHVRKVPRPLLELSPEVPAEVADLAHSMLAKAPAERPSMDAVVAIVDRLRTALPTQWTLPVDGVGGTLPDAAALLSVRPASQKSTDPGLGAELALGATVPGSPLASGRISKESTPLPKSASISNPALSGSSQGGATPLPVALSTTPPPAPRARPAWVGVAAVAVLVAGIGGFIGLRGGNRPGRSSGVAAVGQGSPALRQVRWTVSSVPSGAEVVRADGQVLGSTPWELERVAEPGETMITLRYPGYKGKSMVLGHSTDVRTEIHLEAETPATAAAAPPGDSAGADKGSPSTKKKRGHSGAGSKDSSGKSKGNKDDVELLE